MNDHTIFTRAIHAGEDTSQHFGALSTPIYNATVFAFSDVESGARIHNFEEDGYFYGRLGNPTQTALERAMCELEGGEDALASGSGMATITTAVLSFVRSGDHMIAPDAIYATTNKFFDFMTERFGVETTYVDPADPENYRAAIRPNTKLIYIESPSNPTLKVTDIAAVASIARGHGIPTLCDNTFATPFNQSPLSLGIDAVVHSATKYLGGHSDLSAGVMVGSRETVDRTRHMVMKIFGGAIAPMTAWLVMRGIKTLPVRMERHNENAGRIASFLVEHDKVVKVFYPGLGGHENHDVARRQMSGFGGMISFDVGSVENGRTVLNALKLCTLATSLGGVETIVQHSASMTHANVPKDVRERAGITDGLIRLSVGLESAEDLIADLDQALRKIR